MTKPSQKDNEGNYVEDGGDKGVHHLNPQEGEGQFYLKVEKKFLIVPTKNDVIQYK